MKNLFFWKIPAVIFASLLCLFAQAQTVINLEWETVNGAPSDDIDYSLSVFDGSGNLIVAGNTLTSGEAENFLITKIDPEGNILWETYYDFDDNTDYATAVTVDDNDNILVSGASFSITTNDFDYATLKIDPSGNVLWTVRYDGPATAGDYPTAIKTDYAGNVYVTGTSQGSTTDADFATLKYDDQGSLQWEKRYDFNSLRDGAVGLELSANYQEVIITGASASTATNWDFVTIKYDASNGNALNTVRQPTGANGYDQPVSICKDDNGNIYVTGAALTGNGIGNDMQTIKIDSSFAIEWVRQYDGHGYDDAGKDVKVDANGDIYVVGYAQKADLGFDFMTIKYDDAGNILWTQVRSTAVSSDTAQAEYLDFDTENNVYVTGTLKEGGGSAAITVVYDTNGNVLWETVHDSEDAIPTDMRINLWGAVYVTGKENTTTGTNYFTVKYSNITLPEDIAYDSLGNPLFMKNQLLVRFDPSVLDASKINNLDLNYWDIDDLVTDQTLINLMDQKLDANGDLKNWNLVRVCSNLRTTDTTGTSRLGNTFNIPPIWSLLLLQIPQSVAESIPYEEMDQRDSLNTISKEKILRSSLNYVGTLYSNDPLFSDQLSLGSTTYPKGHISADDAWTFLDGQSEPIGKPSIIVGIIDNGINENHEDIKGNGNFGGLNGSIVDAAFDFRFNPPLSFSYFTGSHGTQMAGIIGALRNNSTGIAGVAGGDLTNSQEGVHFYSMVAADNSGLLIIMNRAINAIVHAATGGSGNSPVVDILNNSYGFEEDPNSTPQVPPVELEDAVRLAFKAEVIISSSRGQVIPGGGPQTPPTTRVFPACFSDDWGINVGGADLQGNRHTTTGNIPNSGRRYLDCFFDNGMDILAPSIQVAQPPTSTTPIVLAARTTSADASMPSNINSYSRTGGSSSATAYTSGVAALLQSYANITLAPEDAENLIEYGATDWNMASDPGYDVETGWGSLNALQSLKLISQENASIQRKIVHRSVSTTFSSRITVSSNITIFLEKDYTSRPILGFPNGVTIPAGSHNVNVYKYVITDTYIPGAHGRLLSVDANRPGYWARNSSSNLWAGPISGNVIPEDNMSLTVTQSAPGMPINATLEGYFYEIISSSGINIFAPIDASSPTLNYSLLIDEGIPTSIETELGTKLKVSPNPVDDILFVEFELSQPQDIQINLFTLEGKELLHRNIQNEQPGIRKVMLSASGLATGLYLCVVEIGGKRYHKKILVK